MPLCSRGNETPPFYLNARAMQSKIVDQKLAQRWLMSRIKVKSDSDQEWDAPFADPELGAAS